MTASAALVREHVAPSPPTPHQRTERALRITYQLVLPTIQRSCSSRLGYSQPSYATQMTLTDELLQDIARDLDWREQWDMLKVAAEAVAEGQTARRIQTQQREDAAVRLLEATRVLPLPQREPVVMRACGFGMREVARRLPGRVWFSLLDDYERGVAAVWAAADDSVRVLG